MLTRAQARTRGAALNYLGLGIRLRSGRELPRPAAPRRQPPPRRRANIEPFYDGGGDMDQEDDFGSFDPDQILNLLGNDLDEYNAPGPVNQLQLLPGNDPPQGYLIEVQITQQFDEDDVPIVNVSVNISVTNDNMFPPDAEGDSIKRLHVIALNAALLRVQQIMPGNGIYGQTRLIADGNERMKYDLTTPMVTIPELPAVFDQSLDDALQSNDQIGTDISDLQFRFTLVDPRGGINPGLVTRTNRIFASTASNARQRRASATEAAERFILFDLWKRTHPNASEQEISRFRRNMGPFVHEHKYDLNLRPNARRERKVKKKKVQAATRLQRFFRRVILPRSFPPPSTGSRSGSSGTGGNRSNYRITTDANGQETWTYIGPATRVNARDQLRATAPEIDDFLALPPPKRGSGTSKRKRNPRSEAQKARYNTNKKAKRNREKARPQSATRITALYRGYRVRRGSLPVPGRPSSWQPSFTDSFGESINGLYDTMKRKIFHHTALDEFFMHSKAVLEVPTTHTEGYCLAMAFIRSQARYYDLTTGDVREVLVSEQICEDHVNDPQCLLITLPILPDYVQYLAGLNYPFLKYNEITKETEGVLFNPYRSRQSSDKVPLARGGMKYQNVLEKGEIQAWYRLAQNFHAYVTCVINESFPEIQSLEYNKESTLQYYADVTQTVICVYRLELQGKRTRVFMPYNFPKDLRQQGSIRVVSILINDNHATAITNLRDFVQNKATANRTTVNGYCLCCEKITTANNETKQASKNHFLKCLETNQGELKSAHKSVLRRQQIASYSAPQFIFNTKSRQYQCRTCNQDIESGIMGQMSHVCRVQFADIKFGEEADLYVYDMECAQVLQESAGQSPCFIHEVNLVCVRRVYPDATGNVDRHAFASLETFMKYVLSITDKNRIYIAHNGGRYDVQFVMQYIEANLIPHQFIPTPASIHAYLSVSIPFGAKLAATFLDFRNFMPGSLKGIGTSFGLSVAKGDFPHRFNNGFNDEYEGSLPPLDHEDDYWCLSSKRTQEDLDEFKIFYEEQRTLFCTCDDVCTCTKQKWHFYGELLKYCWLDVDVLAEACAKYRNNALDFGVTAKEAVEEKEWVSQGIDPFQYLTIPQLAVNLLLNGMPEDTNLTITPMKTRRERNALAIPWLERMNKGILHIGNTNREFFCFATKRYIDGIDPTTHELYVCLDCQFHGCRRCFFTEFETGVDHPTRPATYSRVHRDTEEFVETLLKTYGTKMVHVVWSHELQDVSFSSYELKLGHIMKERDMFYGGRTEVFSPYINGDFYPEDDLQYHDVCSLYPFVCAFKTLPTGNPEHICGSHIDKGRILDLCHPSPYFGYVRAHVTPHPKCLIGLLPYRCPNSGRLEFPLRPMTGSWGTEELRIAIENGYKVDEIYEVYHWSEEERSDTLLRGYVSYFLQMKQVRASAPTTRMHCVHYLTNCRFYL